MQSWRRLLYFILLNVLISAVTTWAVVTIVLRNYAPAAAAPDPTLVVQPDEQNGSVVVTQPPSSAVGAGGQEEVSVTPGDLEIESIIGAGVLATERVLIRHVGEDEVSLIGWQLQDQDGNVFYFPAITIFSKGAVTVYSSTGTSTVVELYWGQEEPIWEVGEKAYLIDPNGDVRAEYQVP